jgi:hypothetical protein
MKLLLLLLSLSLTLILGDVTNSPTVNATIPGIATLRPTAPTMPDVMMPDADRGSPTNKTGELPIAAIYFIMLGITGIITITNIKFEQYVGIISEPEKQIDEEW